MNHKLLTLGLIILLAGCAESPVRTTATMSSMQIVAREDQFALVQLQPGQDYSTLASVFYQDPLEAWQIREVNAQSSAQAGQVVAVPLKPVNPSAVYSDGYRTLPILCYHQFTSNAKTAHRLEVTAKEFERQISYLVANDFQILSFADVNEIMRSGRPIPEKAVVLTIDDGYRSIYDVAWPILKKYNAKATLFIYTDFIGAGTALKWNHLKEMAASDLIEVESHAKTHSSLSQLPDDKDKSTYRARVEKEIRGADEIFVRRLGAKPTHLSYPYGNSSAIAENVAKQQGYDLAATVTRGDNTVFTNPYLLHRTMIYADHDIEEFADFLRTYRRKNLP